MTPRELLEAAGWTQVEDGWIPPPIPGIRWQGCVSPEVEAISQLARDEAKETSDGDGTGINGGSGDVRGSRDLGQVPAPVATSVSAPTEAELEKQWIADGSTNSFKTWLIRKVQGASSSSAALDWAENMIAHYLKCGYLPELSAVEAKNFLGEPLPDKQKWSNPYDELREARDSRDRLQEALRGLAKIPTIMANSYVLQIIEASLGDPPERGGSL